MNTLSLTDSEVRKNLCIDEKDNGRQSPLPSFILTKNGV